MVNDQTTTRGRPARGEHREDTALAAGPLAWTVWLAATLLLLLTAIFGLGAAFRQPHLIAIPQFVELIDDLGIPQRLATTVSFVVPIVSAAVLAVVVFVARRREGMALLFPLGFLGMFVFGSGSPGAVRATLPHLSAMATVAEVVALIALALLLYLFPNGRLQPRWTVFPLVSAIAAVIVFPSLATSVRLAVSDPASVSPGMTVATLMLVLVVIGGAVVSQVIRYRRHATATERQQIRWVLLGFAILVMPATFMIVGVQVLPGRWVGWIILLAAVSGPIAPLTAGIAVFRYRLYDIDRVVSRTIAYLILSGFLGLVYALLVMSLSMVTPTGSDLGVAASTLAVAALFLPARRRIQAFVDVRFHRARYDAYSTLEAFASRLRRQVDLGSLEDDLVVTVQRSLEPEMLSVWLAAPEHQARY